MIESIDLRNMGEKGRSLVGNGRILRKKAKSGPWGDTKKWAELKGNLNVRKKIRKGAEPRNLKIRRGGA